MTYDPREHLGAIHEFIQRHPPEVAAFLTTLKKDGQPFMRQVSTFVEDGWEIGTISRFTNLKMKHIRNDPRVTYLFVEGRVAAPGEVAPGRAMRNVWIQGVVDIIEDPAVVQAFLERRAAARNMPIPAVSYDRLLLRCRPTFLRAEGWRGSQTPVVVRDFSAL